MVRSSEVLDLIPTPFIILSKLCLQVIEVIRYIHWVKAYLPLVFSIVEQDIMYPSISIRVIMGTCTFPHNLITKIARTEDRVQYHLEIMRSSRITMQIEAAGGLEDAVQFHQAGGHHHQ